MVELRDVRDNLHKKTSRSQFASHLEISGSN